MSWVTVSRIKKTKVFTNKGSIYLPSISNNVGWKNSNISTFLTSVSKVGNGLTHEAVTSKSNDNSYNISTTKTTFSSSQSKRFVLKEYRKNSGTDSVSTNISNNFISGGTTSYIVGTLFIEFEELYYSSMYGSSFPWFDFSFNLYIGGVYQGKYHRKHSGGGSGGGHVTVSYPNGVIFGNEPADISRSDAVICLINMTGIYGNGNVEIRDFSLTYDTSQGNFNTLECGYKIILQDYSCDKLSTSVSDSQCLSIAYELN